MSPFELFATWWIISRVIAIWSVGKQESLYFQTAQALFLGIVLVGADLFMLIILCMYALHMESRMIWGVY